MATEIYRVKSGESLSIIARDMLGDMQRWPEIAFLNGVSFPYFIHPGQVLQLPPVTGGDIFEVVNLNVSLPKQTTDAPVAKSAGLFNRSATILLLAVGAFFFFNRSK